MGSRKPKAAKTSQPAVTPPAGVVPAKAEASAEAPMTVRQEIALLEKRIEADQARLHKLRNPKVEYPKWVTSTEGETRVFDTKEQRNAAGPKWAEQER